ncbi:carboxypeptidase-like regulatory domain-containing protein [Ekhidna sp.]|uniref:carboxypeptidase-like regulatory domain-containing protein n=1 Tax=Ekhidna sp. TaxID=2608089 RepID=UPI003299EC2D
MILTQSPDPNISTWELENALKVIKDHVQTSSKWQLREEYIDRGILDPYYILMIRKAESDRLDDVWDQKVLKTSTPSFSYVHRTSKCTKAYWCDIDNYSLQEVLDCFKKNYDLNRLQLPGLKGDLFDPKDPHEAFEKRRYIYEIISPVHRLTGIGPSMYAIGLGAVCGTVYNLENQPLDDVEVQLQMGEDIQTRSTRDGGHFWFSKVRGGDYNVIVKNRSCTLQVIRRDEFGNIKGWLTDQDGYPVANTDVHFKAPDKEVFSATTDGTGKFSTGPVPAFPVSDTPLANYPYVMDVPDFLFSISKSVLVKDAIISGLLRTQEGKIISNKEIILMKKGIEVTRTSTDGHGNFQFFGLEGGTYKLSVPERTIYLNHLSNGKITGKLENGTVNETRIELIAHDSVVTTERLSRDKAFTFDRVPPGKYEVKTKLSE